MIDVFLQIGGATMRSLLARCLGITAEVIPPEALLVVLERASTLSRGEARVVVFEYRGYTRADMIQELQVSAETLKTYWKRIYHKLGCRDRQAVKAWVEHTIRQHLGETAPH
jgi:DNA-binding CsgD family transcriptional regulator